MQRGQLVSIRGVRNLTDSDGNPIINPQLWRVVDVFARTVSLCGNDDDEVYIEEIPIASVVPLN